MAKATLRRWQTNPVSFVTEALRVKRIEKWQEAALNALVNEDRVAIRSGHGVGKSAFLAWVILWWMCTRFPAKVPCTAPTAHQLDDVLWGELGKWTRQLPDELRAYINLTGDRLEIIGAQNESFAVARTARREQPEAFQGFHSENLLFIVDEASGVDDLIFEVGEGAMSTPGAKTILTGNPTKRSGHFFRAFHEQRERWHCMQVRCQDVAGAPFAKPQYIDDMRESYGEDSDIFRIRVLGEFPLSDVNQFIGTEIVEECAKYTAAGFDDQPLLMGVDVARFGDDRSVIAFRRGRKVFPLIKLRGMDTMRFAEHIAEQIDAKKPDRVFIDGVGVGGGVVDRLKQLVDRRLVVEVNGGAQPVDTKAYANKRAEMWGRMRDFLKARAELPDDPELRADLGAPQYAYTNKQQIILERKEDMKKRGEASPDCADAVSLTFASKVVHVEHPMFSRRARTADADYEMFA